MVIHTFWVGAGLFLWAIGPELRYLLWKLIVYATGLALVLAAGAALGYGVYLMLISRAQWAFYVMLTFDAAIILVGGFFVGWGILVKLGLAKPYTPKPAQAE